MLHDMKLHSEPFELILSGRKTYELRLWDEKRQRISPADRIRFTCSDDPSKQFTATVRALHRFPDFKALYQALPLEACGYLPEQLENASPDDMTVYYSQEQQAKYGVVALEISVD
jgi:ASC-1-like (ASCH) protein